MACSFTATSHNFNWYPKIRRRVHEVMYQRGHITPSEVTLLMRRYGLSACSLNTQQGNVFFIGFLPIFTFAPVGQKISKSIIY